ncbi:MAG: tRNA (guanosine(37)-N1)-methyltransferase TrmD [Patescibacteria group bacterium]|nr:tRNA (guanosine(37)-N1)-methyltransferase TrmD [Patescibacteria group bacterium]
MFEGPFSESIIKRAQEKGLVKINVTNIRNFATDRHKTVDDTPYGGGAGMVLKVDVMAKALDSISDGYRILLTPQGKLLNQEMVTQLSKRPHLVLIAGHYEGFDERIREYLVDQEVSIGDYVLTGGELAAVVVVDAVLRHVPGVLGKEESAKKESFSNNLLEYPQYTRPEEFQGWKVPDLLLSGDHEKIEKWRQEQALKRTKEKRPDLLTRKDCLSQSGSD